MQTATNAQLDKLMDSMYQNLNKQDVAPCSGTGEHINVNKVICSLMNPGQSICTSISQSNINQQFCTILLKLVNISCHLVY